MLQARLDILYMRDTEATMETSEPIMALPPIDGPVGVPLLARDTTPRLSQMSQITLESSQPEWHNYGEPCPSPNVPTGCDPTSRAHMPQFRQSRRWAKMYAWSRAEMEAAPSSLDHQNRSPARNRYSSVAVSNQHVGRPLSLQPHYGLPRAMAKSLGRPKARRNISDASAGSPHGGLCVQSAAYYWRCVKPLISKVPRAGSNVWPSRRTGTRKATTRRQDAAGRRPSALVFVPTHSRRASTLESDSHPTCCEPSMTLTNGVLGSCLLEHGGCTGLASSSSMPSLRGPVINDRFSDQSRTVLKNVKVDNDRSLPTTSTVPSVVVRSTTTSKHISHDFAPTSEKPVRRLVPSEYAFKPLPPSPKESTISLLDDKVSPAVAAQPPQHRELAAQASKNTLSSLDTVLHNAQNESRSVVLSSGQSRQMNSRLQSHGSTPNLKPRPTHTGPVIRLSSARSAKSANTLAGIEAQVQKMAHYTIDVEIKRNGSVDSDSRYSGPPPTIPLPALPPEAHDAKLGAAKPSQNLSRVEGGRDESLQICLHLEHHSIQSTRADKVRERRMRDLAKSRSPRSKLDTVGKHQTCEKPSVSKTPKALTYQADELDRFPAVPESRPTSLSTASCYSRQHSPEMRIRQPGRLSKAKSSETQRNTPQKLSQSNIFVVVDTDPVTARFRAGAVSPRFSIAGSAAGPTSPKTTRTPSKLREVMANRLSLCESPRRGAVLGSPMESPRRKAAGTSPSGEQALKLRRSRSYSSGQSMSPGRIDSPTPSSSSEDQWLTPGEKISPVKTSSQQRKRRRWNSGDINLVRQLHQDLHDYYVTILEQEEKIKVQASQIQTIMNMFAPMKHTHGRQDSLSLQDSPGRDNHSGHRQIRKCRSALAERRPPSSGSRSRFPLDRINERTLNIQSHKVVDKSDAASTAPSSDTMSLASLRASASDTSLTEQERLTAPSRKGSSDVENWGWI
ncbi:hypothetical protein FOPE_11090 [Fonsecaea pedrosoi]|nr:hypothetical protein FOPE_11090 [Fonsecaea pedrosoi]